VAIDSTTRGVRGRNRHQRRLPPCPPADRHDVGVNEMEADMTTTAHAQRTFATRVDIPEDARAELVELLNARLADTFDLYSQLKQAHWNVKGSDFVQLHELYDAIAAIVIDAVDDVAERATALGGLALGTARLAASASTLDEYPLDAVDGPETLHAVADRLGAYASAVRAAIGRSEELGDADTADLFTEISREIDKQLWFVEAHLQA
jgi:starvation-inducible DNA-binding protein